MSHTQSIPWLISLHGGHSQAYCDHAYSPLEQMIERAVEAGAPTYGITEHAPRVEPRFLYPDEIQMGWDVPKLEADFRAYAERSKELVAEYSDRIELLRGFEIEVVPTDGWVELMKSFRHEYEFDYIVGSVHYVDEILFDLGPEGLKKAIDHCGGAEAFAVRYYRGVAAMVEAMTPEIVAHLDVIRKYADTEFDTPAIRHVVGETLEAIRESNGILDVNTNGFRKGLDSPFPAPWIVGLARDMGIPFCFGDDSHAADQVTNGIPEARDYLAGHGVTSITTLMRENGAIGRRVVPLE